MCIHMGRSDGCIECNNDKHEVRIKELRSSLLVAVLALEIASDWDLVDVQCYPPKEWKLEAFEEDSKDGWCSTALLAEKLRNIAG